MQGHLGPRDLCLNKLGKGPLGMQCYIPNFKDLSIVVLNIFYVHVHVFLWFQPRTPVAEPSWILRP